MKAQQQLVKLHGLPFPGLDPSQPFRILEINRIPGSGNLKGFASVTYGDLVIQGCRIIAQPGQRLYVAWPQLERGGRFFPVIRSSSETRKGMENVVLAEWREVNPSSQETLHANSSHTKTLVIERAGRSNVEVKPAIPGP